jgi:hypothetical protein
MNPATLPKTKDLPDQNKPGRFTLALRSTFLIFLSFFPLTFLFLSAHEGGHALVNVIYRVPHTFLYVHPFGFAGYSLPVFDEDNFWLHLGGPVMGLLLPLIPFLLLWVRRNYSNLLLVLLFPWALFWQGLSFLDLYFKTGDLYQVSRLTGVPPGAALYRVPLRRIRRTRNPQDSVLQRSWSAGVRRPLHVPLTASMRRRVSPAAIALSTAWPGLG